MKNLIRANVLIPLLLLIAGVVWVYMAFALYGFWDPRQGPMGGFFPGIFAGIMALFALAALYSGLKETPVRHDSRIALPYLGVLAVIVCCYVVGLFPAMTAYLFVWLRYMGKYPLKKTLVLTVCMIAGLYGIFVVWLGVSFPAGIVYELLFRRA